MPGRNIYDYSFNNENSKVNIPEGKELCFSELSELYKLSKMDLFDMIAIVYRMGYEAGQEGAAE